MEPNFKDALINAMNRVRTENDGVAYATTKSSLLDFFSQAGAMRTRPDNEVLAMFGAAYVENPLLATKALFYFRNVRGGQGERKVFRTIARYLADTHPEVVIKNLGLIKEFGRWDDYYSLVGTKVEPQMWAFLRDQFNADLLSETPSLLGKWLKSENTSSPASRLLGRQTRIAFNIGNSKTYRKLLTQLRAKIDIVERRMSDKQWETIKYERVPSRASLIYKDAFRRHDTARYVKYLEDVKSGKAKINASTLYPYDIVERILSKGEQGETADLLWNALPNYITKEENSIAVCDVSGSMAGQPMAVSVSLGLYLAERNKGIWKDYFMTFSEHPQLQKVVGENIRQKVMNLSRANWDMNTDIEAVFTTLLDTAVKNGISNDEMIKKVYVISDMEFDRASNGSYDETVFETVKRKYAEAGYELPTLVFWNVSARNKQFPMTIDDKNTRLVSGCSPSIFTNLMKDEMKSPYDLMLDVLNDPKYDVVVV